MFWTDGIVCCFVIFSSSCQTLSAAAVFNLSRFCVFLQASSTQTCADCLVSLKISWCIRSWPPPDRVIITTPLSVLMSHAVFNVCVCVCSAGSAGSLRAGCSSSRAAVACFTAARCHFSRLAVVRVPRPEYCYP